MATLEPAPSNQLPPHHLPLVHSVWTHRREREREGEGERGREGERDREGGREGEGGGRAEEGEREGGMRVHVRTPTHFSISLTSCGSVQTTWTPSSFQDNFTTLQ